MVHAVGRAARDALDRELGRRRLRERPRRRHPADDRRRRDLGADHRHRRRRPPGHDDRGARLGGVRGRSRRRAPTAARAGRCGRTAWRRVYSRAVAVCGDTVFVSSSTGPRGGRAAVYRAAVARRRLRTVRGGARLVRRQRRQPPPRRVAGRPLRRLRLAGGRALRVRRRGRPPGGRWPTACAGSAACSCCRDELGVELAVQHRPLPRGRLGDLVEREDVEGADVGGGSASVGARPSRKASGPNEPFRIRCPTIFLFFFRYRAESATPIRALIVISFVSSATPGMPRCKGIVIPSARIRVEPRRHGAGVEAHLRRHRRGRTAASRAAPASNTSSAMSGWPSG